MLIFVVSAVFLLIFEKVFNEKQHNYECDKGKQYPLYTLVVFKVQCFILSIHGDNDDHKNYYKKGGKN